MGEDGLGLGLGLDVVLIEIAGLAEKLDGVGSTEVLLVGEVLEVVLNWNGGGLGLDVDLKLTTGLVVVTNVDCLIV